MLGLLASDFAQALRTDWFLEDGKEGNGKRPSTRTSETAVFAMAEDDS